MCSMMDMYLPTEAERSLCVGFWCWNISITSCAAQSPVLSCEPVVHSSGSVLSPAGGLSVGQMECCQWGSTYRNQPIQESASVQCGL